MKKNRFIVVLEIGNINVLYRKSNKKKVYSSFGIKFITIELGSKIIESVIE